jgi:hypothetical protein
MKTTSVAHLMIERLASQGCTFTFPDTVSGDMIEEHDYAMSSAGFDLINQFQKLFNDICNEVDLMIASGTVHFTDEGLVVFH